MFLYSLLFFALLPIIFYLFARHQDNKNFVFLFSIIIFGSISLLYFSPHAIIGTFSESKLMSRIDSNIKKNNELSFEDLNSISSLQNEELGFIYLSQLITNSLKTSSFDSADSIIQFISSKYVGDEYQIEKFELLTQIRDAKYPDYLNAEIRVRNFLPVDCQENGKIQLITQLFLKNGPSIPISYQELNDYNLVSNFFIDKATAPVNGFDLPSMILNKETGVLNLALNCDEQNFLLSKEVSLNLNIESFPLVMNILQSEWSKKEQ